MLLILKVKDENSRDLPDNKPQTPDRPEIWETHMELFISVLVLVAIILVLIVFLVYEMCKHRDSSQHRVSNIQQSSDAS